MAVIDDAPRSATAIAHTQVQLYEIDKSVIDNMINDLSPLFRAIVSSLIKRVHSLNHYATEKTSIAHLLVSMSHLIELLEQQQSDTRPHHHSTDVLQNDNTIPKDLPENHLEIKTILVAAKNILGYTDQGSLTLLEKYASLKLAKLEMVNRKRVFTFKANNFVKNVDDMIIALGDASNTGLSAELEYIDLKEIASHLNIMPQRLIEAISNGRIPPEAVVLKNSLVQQSIREQGKLLF